MLLSLDAIVRSLIRTLVSGKRLLEWETAAQSESGGGKPTPLDVYLQISPLVAIVIALALAFRHLPSLFAAGPILLLWIIAPVVVLWLDSPPRSDEGPLTASDRLFLQDQAMHVWRYFQEFGGEKNHWLIPDNVEEKNTLQVLKLSPTNLGMLFNARQAAYEFGFLTLPEFAQAHPWNARDLRPPREAARPHLQLVRHRNPPTHPSAHRLRRRQRQPRSLALHSAHRRTRPTQTPATQCRHLLRSRTDAANPRE